MIVADTSAILAIAFAEPERDRFLAILTEARTVLVSTVSVVETRMVIHGRRGQRAVVIVDDLLRLPMFEIVPPDQAQTDAAYQAGEKRPPIPDFPLPRKIFIPGRSI